PPTVTTEEFKPREVSPISRNRSVAHQVGLDTPRCSRRQLAPTTAGGGVGSSVRSELDLRLDARGRPEPGGSKSRPDHPLAHPLRVRGTGSLDGERHREAAGARTDRRGRVLQMLKNRVPGRLGFRIEAGDLGQDVDHPSHGPYITPAHLRSRSTLGPQPIRARRGVEGTKPPRQTSAKDDIIRL